MKLSALVQDLAVTGDLGSDPEVFGVRHDSRAVEPGELFVTWSGAKFDGRLFAGQALERGAVAVLADRPRPAEAPPEFPGSPPPNRAPCSATSPRRSTAIRIGT